MTAIRRTLYSRVVSLMYLADAELFPKVKKMDEGSESAQTAATGARTVPPLSKAAESCRVISSFSTDSFAEFFSPRAMDRGGLFAMEGFVDGVEVSVEESGAVKIQGRCYASLRKKLRRPVEISLNSNLSFTDSLCTCTAGQNNCAHAAGVLVYVAQFCRHVRVLNEDDEGEEATQSTGDAEVTPPTSKPRA